MKHYKTIVKHTTYCDSTICDFCNKEIDTSRYGEFDQVKITRETGVAYPEYTGFERLRIDCCVECFNNKVLPKLKELAINEFAVEEIDV